MGNQWTELNKEYVIEPSGYVTDTALRETNLRMYPRRTLLLALYGEGKNEGQMLRIATR